MDANRIADFRSYYVEWSQDLELLRQNRLLDEGQFIRFARDRGIDVWGVGNGDPGDFHSRGWLTSDGGDDSGHPLFHPFRIYPLYKILQACKVNLAPSASLHRDTFVELAKHAHGSLPNFENIGELAQEKNRIVDFALLLEPIYWPRITGHIYYNANVGEHDFISMQNEYRRKVLTLVESLDQNVWQKVHESLRHDAAWIDDNRELYLLLRVGNWNQREGLIGPIAGALWIRHIGEVIRLAFEAVQSNRWFEEDRGFETWRVGGRKMKFGSERPLDDELRSKPYLALRFGVFTGSVVRWYVEGETEYYAILKVLPEPSAFGLEIVNLRGNIVAERDNVALKLRDCLTEDKALRRFSIISFDLDVDANVKTIRRQVDKKNVVGLIAAHKPDFEFANFTIQELAEVAARIDEANGVSGESVRTASWASVETATAFQARYKEVSARHPPGLKGKEWGTALAVYAVEHPNRSDTGAERPFWKEIDAALQARSADYDFQRAHFSFNRETFEQVDERVIGKTPNKVGGESS